MTTAVESTPAPEGLTPPDEPLHAKPGATRKPMSIWARGRLIALFVLAWFVIVWASMADDPILPFRDAAIIQLSDSQWLLWLTGADPIRKYSTLERSVAANLSLSCSIMAIIGGTAVSQVGR